MKTPLFFFFLAFLLLLSCTEQPKTVSSPPAIPQPSTSPDEQAAPSNSPMPTPQQQSPPANDVQTPSALPPPLPLQETGSASKVVEIQMVAKKFEFVPSEVRVKKGDTVRLKVTSTDVPHGIAIPGYDIAEGLPVNEERVVEFVADKAGTFDFYCSVYCGSGHGAMRGKLIVE